MVSTAAFHARVRGSVPGLGGLKETNLFLPHPRVKVSIVGSLRDREVACSASDRQGSNFESCVWRTVLSQSSHHPQEVLLAQFSLYVHKGGLKPDSFHFLLKNYFITIKWYIYWSKTSLTPYISGHSMTRVKNDYSRAQPNVYPTMQCVFTRTNIYLKRQNQTEQWRVLEGERDGLISPYVSYWKPTSWVRE